MIAVLANHHRRTDRTLPGVVVARHVVVPQKRQQLIAVLPAPLGQTLGIAVIPVVGTQPDQTALEVRDLSVGLRLGQLAFESVQLLRVPVHAHQTSAERVPLVVPPRLLIDRRDVPKQVRPALLLIGAHDRVVRSPKVRDQCAFKGPREELRKRRRAPAAVDQVLHRGVTGEAPQPVRLAGDPPGRLVGVQLAGVEDHLMDLLVPSEQDVGQPVPHLDQPAGGDLHPQVEVERLDDLADRQALQKVQQRRQNQRAVAQRTPRQDVGRFGFDAFAASVAVAAVQDVPGDDGLEVFGDVLGDAFASLAGRPQFVPALGAVARGMLAGAVGLDRCLSASSGVSFLSALFATLLRSRGGRLGVRRDGRRGGVGPSRRGGGGEPPLDLHQREGGHLGVAADQPSGVLLTGVTGKKPVDERRIDGGWIDRGGSLHGPTSRTDPLHSAKINSRRLNGYNRITSHVVSTSGIGRSMRSTAREAAACFAGRQVGTRMVRHGGAVVLRGV